MNRMLSLTLLALLAASTGGVGAAHASAPGDTAGSGGGDKGSQLGQRQHKPMDEPPAGSTAKCKDGTYSTDKNRKTACSAKGGIAKWLKD